MFKSLDDYRNAVQGVALQPVSVATMCRRHPRFRGRSREAFKAFVGVYKDCSAPALQERSSQSYASPRTQAMWLSWCEAVLYAPTLARLTPRDPFLEMNLFLAHVKSLGHELQPFELQTKKVPAIVLDRWTAWKAALEFGYGLATAPEAD